MKGVFTILLLVLSNTFMAFTFIFFKNESIKANHIIGFLVLAVYFIFKK